MHLILIALVLVLPLVVQGVHTKSLREESEDNIVYKDLDYGSDDYVLDYHSTTAKPKHHVHPLVMASDLNYTDLCECFSAIDISKECRQRYPDNLRILRGGSIEMAYYTHDEGLLSSHTLPLLVLSSGKLTSLKIENESLVLLCEASLGSNLETLYLHHISRLHVNGQIPQNRSSPIYLTFRNIGTPISFHEGSLKFLPTGEDNNSMKVTLSFYRCTEVAFDENSVVAPHFVLTAEYVNQLKFTTKAIKLTSKTPLLRLKVKGENGMKLSMDTNSITYENLNLPEEEEVCVIGSGPGTSFPVVVLELIGSVVLAEDALALLPCTNLTLRKVHLEQTGPNAITNVRRQQQPGGTTINWVHVRQLTGDSSGLAPGSICLMANTVWATDNKILPYNTKGDQEDVIRLSGKSVNNTGSTIGVHTCQQKTKQSWNMEGCQICQVNDGTKTLISASTSSGLTKQLLHNSDQISTTTTATPTTLHNQDAWYNNKMVIMYLVVAASIFVLTIITACIIHAIKKRKKRMSWKVPSLPWAKSHYNSRHPALAAKAAYCASQNISGKPECYTIFDSIAAARQVKQTPASHQNDKEIHPIEENKDEQECTYSEPIDTISTSRRHSHVYANPSSIKGVEGRLDRFSSLSERRLSASTASVASSIADLNMISALSTQDRRKSSYGLLIDITSALGIESNYKQLTNK